MIELISPLNGSCNYILAENCIDIWQFSLLTPPKNSEAILNSDEKLRAKRFYFEHHRRRYTAARATMRIILGRYLNCPPAEIDFAYTPHGKPLLATSQQLEFNLSHSQDLALLAVGKKFPVGIDIEFFSARDYFGIARNLFSPLEMKALKESKSFYKPWHFFHIWSQKEAFIKASGLGLSYPTGTFTVAIQERVFKVEDLLHNKYWQLLTYMPTVACCAALCCEMNVTTINKFYYPSD